jgi:hypothetical protein
MDLLNEIKVYLIRRAQLKAVLWILFVGGAVVLITRAEAWFVAEIINLLILTRFLDWESIEISLQEIVKSQHLIILSKVVWQKVSKNFQGLRLLAPG